MIAQTNLGGMHATQVDEGIFALAVLCPNPHSTVTLFAKFRGLSTSHSRNSAI